MPHKRSVLALIAWAVAVGCAPPPATAPSTNDAFSPPLAPDLPMTAPAVAPPPVAVSRPPAPDASRRGSTGGAPELGLQPIEVVRWRELAAFVHRVPGHMWREAGTALNRAVYGKEVGRVDDPTGHVLVARAAGRRPLLVPEGLRFRTPAGDQPDCLDFANSSRAFEFIHREGRGLIDLQVVFWAHRDEQVILDSTSTFWTGHRGFALFRDGRGRIQFFVAKGELDHPVVHAVSSATIAADGRPHRIRVVLDGQRAHLTIDGRTEHFEFVNPPGGGPGTSDLTIACRSGTYVGNADITLGWLAIFDGPLDPDRQAELTRFVPRATDVLVGRVAGPNGPARNFRRHDFDFTSARHTYADLSGPISATLGGPVVGVDDQAHPRIGWIATATSIAATPRFTGDDGAYFDGQDDALSLPASLPDGGAQTIIIEAKNDDHADGSHPLSQPGSYIAVTGDNYPGNGDQDAYFVVHPHIGDTAACRLANETGFNVIESAQDGLRWRHRCGGDDVFAENAAGFTPTSIGRDAHTDGPGRWWMHGNIRRIIVFTTYLSAEDVARVLAEGH